MLSLTSWWSASRICAAASSESGGNASKTMPMAEDTWGTADATTEGEDMEVETTATEATEAAGMTTGTGITQEPERKAQETENPEAGGTPGGRLETGRTEGGTTVAMAEAPATAIRTPEAVARAAESPEDG